MTSPRLVIGVDPGGQHVGIVARRGLDELVAHVTIDRGATEPRDAWARRVAVEVDDLLGVDGGTAEVPIVGIEDVVKPNPHQRRRDGNSLTNLDGILDTAVVLGALLLANPDAILVPPGGNGSNVMDAYPRELRPTRGRGAGHDRLRHVRSAWDVAGAALWLHRLPEPHR